MKIKRGPFSLVRFCNAKKGKLKQGRLHLDAFRSIRLDEQTEGTKNSRLF